MDAFVTLAGVLPSLRVGGLVSARGLNVCLPAPPGYCHIRTVIYVNWQVGACGSAAICGKTITCTTCVEASTEAADAERTAYFTETCNLKTKWWGGGGDDKLRTTQKDEGC